MKAISASGYYVTSDGGSTTPGTVTLITYDNGEVWERQKGLDGQVHWEPISMKDDNWGVKMGHCHNCDRYTDHTPDYDRQRFLCGYLCGCCGWTNSPVHTVTDGICDHCGKAPIDDIMGQDKDRSAALERE